jgi:hypothetical protein
MILYTNERSTENTSDIYDHMYLQIPAVDKLVEIAGEIGARVEGTE